MWFKDESEMNLFLLVLIVIDDSMLLPDLLSASLVVCWGIYNLFYMQEKAKFSLYTRMQCLKFAKFFNFLEGFIHFGDEK